MTSISRAGVALPPPATATSASGGAAAPAKTASAPSGSEWAPPLSGEWAHKPGAGKSDPINLYLHGSLAEVQATFKRAGWTEAVPLGSADNRDYAISGVADTVLGRSSVAQSAWSAVVGLIDKATGADLPTNYVQGTKSMPVSTLTYDGKPQVMAFEMNNHLTSGRDHLRIFATGKVDAQGRPVWAVAASRDSGLIFDPNRPQTAFTNHAVQPDADLERDFVLRTLRQAAPSAQVETLALGGFGATPSNGLNTRDGKAYDVTLP